MAFFKDWKAISCMDGGVSTLRRDKGELFIFHSQVLADIYEWHIIVTPYLDLRYMLFPGLSNIIVKIINENLNLLII